ncbi:trypsin-like peptidase domain-containing protein [Bradyrhizobium sp. ERR14]|uniref:trypsin-like peptidase domain-containing protein n=1 Tax=Bradyrhizobium sp. ERR14 TaxID=2663837 RepID=UPI001610FDFE|nr:trypsin-like peptidase domain-containing protein [Bradyrhizobium sp. ERR14]MBB4398529.1 V8-like Glu-specific endopeptidase [Bradyrhizobium sp. ERR14]
MEHFSQDEIQKIAEVTMEVFGYDPPVRAALLQGMPRRFAGLLPGGMTAPTIGLKLDLDYLNTVPRLDDGNIPLKSWLRNASWLAAGRADAEPLRRFHEAIDEKVTGSPPIKTVGFTELQEVVVHHDDMLPYAYMKAGVSAGEAVAKLLVTRYLNSEVQKNSSGNPSKFLGTGWLVAPGLMLTNNHVVNAREKGEPPASDSDFELQAKSTVALFDYDADGAAGSSANAIELIARDRRLDYALLRIDSGARKPLSHGQKLAATSSQEDRLALNIIQHPDGDPKKFAIRNNLLTAATDTELRYFTDTMAGSSGSPVLNDLWEAVGLHRGATRVTGVKFNGRDVAYANVGTQLSAIKTDLAQRYRGKVPELGI